MQRGSDCSKAGLSQTESQAPPALWPGWAEPAGPGQCRPRLGSRSLNQGLRRPRWVHREVPTSLRAGEGTVCFNQMEAEESYSGRKPVSSG